MYVHKDHHIGDAWYFIDGDTGTIHMFYLANPLDGGPRFVGHAVSKDLVNWKELSPALQTGSSGTWDDLLICTGSVIQHTGRYWMAYSATSSTDSSLKEPYRFQRAGMAVSEDLLTWKKLPENPVTQAESPHYEQMSTAQRKMVHWRDPFLFGDGNFIYQFVCARRSDGDIATRGTVALAQSTDMQTWKTLPPIEHDRIAEEMEVPQIYLIDGRWYLTFCTLGRFLSPQLLRQFEGKIPERSNFSMVGDSPFGPFHLHGTGQIVCHPTDDYFYAAQLVNFQGQWYLLATICDDASQRISDPLPVHADETGLHA